MNEKYDREHGWITYDMPESMLDGVTAIVYLPPKDGECRECHRTFMPHAERLWRFCTFHLYEEISARSGYCLECMEEIRNQRDRWKEAYIKASAIEQEVHTVDGDIRTGCEIVEIEDGVRYAFTAPEPVRKNKE